jgi:hypothetical protein
MKSSAPRIDPPPGTCLVKYRRLVMAHIACLDLVPTADILLNLVRLSSWTLAGPKHHVISQILNAHVNGRLLRFKDQYESIERQYIISIYSTKRHSTNSPISHNVYKSKKLSHIKKLRRSGNWTWDLWYVQRQSHHCMSQLSNCSKQKSINAFNKKTKVIQLRTWQQIVKKSLYSFELLSVQSCHSSRLRIRIEIVILLQLIL